MMISFTGIGEDRETGLEVKLVLGYLCQIRDAFETFTGEISKRQLNI